VCDCIIFHWASARGSAVSAEADKTLISQEHVKQYVSGGLDVCIPFCGLPHLKGIFNFPKGADFAD
jgi:hypothetical protein